MNRKRNKIIRGGGGASSVPRSSVPRNMGDAYDRGFSQIMTYAVREQEARDRAKFEQGVRKGKAMKYINTGNSNLPEADVSISNGVLVGDGDSSSNGIIPIANLVESSMHNGGRRKSGGRKSRRRKSGGRKTHRKRR